jgi:hypothetical protein
MSGLILMYVFFDKIGNIKAITPNLNESYLDEFLVATFPLKDVEMFLTLEENTFDYSVKTIERVSKTTYKIVRKQPTITHTKTLKSYLSEVKKVDDPVISFINNVTNKCIQIELNKDVREFYLQNNDLIEENDIIDNFINAGVCSGYLTKKGDPYHLLFTFSFNPKDLILNEKIYINYENNYNSCSLYTKKLINGYNYKEEA